MAKDYFCLPQRVILSIMGFLAIVNAYTMRVSLSLALTRLVKRKNYTDDEDALGEIVCKPDILDPELPIGGNYAWSEELQGYILSSFYVGYIVTHVPGGILADKFGGKWTLGLGIASTSLLTFLTPLAIEMGGANALIALRILMGMGEGTTFPALSQLLSKWIPAKERGKLGALVLGGGQVGTILANSISGFLLDAFDWPIVFYTFGAVAFIWFIVFCFICFSDPGSNPYVSDNERAYLEREITSVSPADLPPIPWKAIFTNVPMYALVCAQIGHDWGFYIIITDLPKYMSDIMQFSIKRNGLYSSLPSVMMWICSIASGFAADLMLTREIMTLTNIRKFMTALAAFGPAIFLVAASYAGCNRLVALLYFTIGMGLMGAYYGGMKLSPLDMSPNFSGTLMAITNGIGAITGVLAPSSVGLMTPNATLLEWRVVFWVAFFVLNITAVIYCIWASAEIQPFNDPNFLKNQEAKKKDG